MIRMKDDLMKSVIFYWEGKIYTKLEVVQEVIGISELVCVLLVWIAKLLKDVLYVHAKTYLKGNRIFIISDLTKSDPFLKLDVYRL